MSVFKTHVALRVTDLARSVEFYRAMFGLDPVKLKADYAKFDVENPGLNLTLNVGSDLSQHGALSHLGVQVDRSQAVEDAIARFQAAGLDTLVERDTDCCYALQDKVWVTDPDRNRWEVFALKVADTAPEEQLEVVSTQVPSSCCA